MVEKNSVRYIDVLPKLFSHITEHGIQEFVVNLLMSIKQMKNNYGGKCIRQKNHMILIERNMK